MTHSSHRFATLSADDVALCRAHSEAIDEARESRALQRWADAVAPLVAPVMSVRAFEVGNHMPADLPMPPSYWDDLEHWLNTLAPAKPAGPQPCQAPVAWDGVHRYGNRAEYDKALAALFVSGQAIAPTPMSYIDFSEAQWDGSPKTGVVGIGNLTIDCGGSTICNGASACRGFETKKHYRDWFRSLRDPCLAAQLASTSSADGAALIGERPAEPRTIPVPWDQWHEKAMRDMVKPAQQPAQNASTEADYLVCIGLIPGISIGDVVKQVGGGFDADYWRRCDESGWVTHVPTADAVCPVPDGIDFEAKWPDGDVSSLSARHLRTSCIRAWSFDGGDVGGLSAWRPIAQS